MALNATAQQIGGQGHTHSGLKGSTPAAGPSPICDPGIWPLPLAMPVWGPSSRESTRKASSCANGCTLALGTGRGDVRVLRVTGEPSSGSPRCHFCHRPSSIVMGSMGSSCTWGLRHSLSPDRLLFTRKSHSYHCKCKCSICSERPAPHLMALRQSQHLHRLP